MPKLTRIVLSCQWSRNLLRKTDGVWKTGVLHIDSHNLCVQRLSFRAISASAELLVYFWEDSPIGRNNGEDSPTKTPIIMIVSPGAGGWRLNVRPVVHSQLLHCMILSHGSVRIHLAIHTVKNIRISLYTDILWWVTNWAHSMGP